MYLEIFTGDFAVFRIFLGISRDFAEIPEFRGSATARNIRSPVTMPSTLTSALLLNIYFLSIRTKETIIDIHDLNTILLIFGVDILLQWDKVFCTMYIV